MSNNQAAIEDYNQAIRLNPNFAEAYNNRGAAHHTLGNNQTAINDYNQAIRLNPNFAEAYNNRGTAHHTLGNNQTAINDYNQAIRLKPNYTEAYNNRGTAHHTLGNNQTAINDYNQAIRLKPNYTEAKTNLDIARSKLEKIQKPKVSHTTNSETSTTTDVSQEYIDALNLSDIHRKIDQIVTVKGQVASVNVDKYNNIIYFNFAENTYQGFYAYVPTSSGHKFPHPTKYSGKTVIISGKISLNKNKRPRMALNNSSQLKDAE
ncbi:tetratricopeptide repeat protein [Nostoc sphaeroides CHAB 2801]|uniref:tetratricopeptide repeat protein n=1 Tax=Nostoc sphaeroides TaxID=446679 RepID=UPI000E4B95C3|nr:tetratricopeptide repeat protein [Nostoc sphaeroides]MCC5631689.1 tetratricopeptide repeat protein [Nostoc sphaeroides CHAB 2801]